MSSHEVIEGFQLSAQQKEVWRRGGGAAALVQARVDVEGVLDVERLERALSRIVARHEILRTRYERLPGMEIPIQVIEEPRPCRCRRLASEADDPRCEREEVESEPGLRCLLIERSARRHLLILTLPALCADSRSLDNLIGELAREHATDGAGAEPEEPLQYVQFSEWQNEVLEEEAAEEREFWREQERARTAPLSLPIERAATDERGQGGEVAGFEVPPEEVALAEKLAKLHGASLSGLALACWVALLARLGERSELTVEVFFDGRRYEELETALGAFGRYLPLTLRALPERPFHRELARVARRLEKAAAAESFFLPAEGEDDEAGVPTAIGFDFEQRMPSLEAGGVSFSLLDKRLPAGDFCLRLAAVRHPGGLRLELHDPGALYRAAELRRLAMRLQSLWNDVLARPETIIAELEVLSPQERELLAGHNHRSLEVPEPRSLPRRLEERARCSPDAVAVVAGSGQLSFRELDRRAEHLARELIARGVGPESRVGLYLERSAEQIVALVAVWKAGAAYLPIDLVQPRERLTWMLEDAGVEWVLSQRSLAERLLDGQPRLLLVDEERAAPAAPAPLAVHPENLAYVIYTSGSTGRPKGVLIEQRSVVNLTAALAASIDDGLATAAPLRVAVNAPLAFDASVKQVLQLLDGHALVIIEETVRSEGAAMLDLLERERVDVLDCTPSHLRLLLAAGLCAGASRGAFPRRVLVGGEAIDTATWKLLAGDGRSFYNVYGPTECTVDASLCRVEPASRPHIGWALPNVRLFVLDRRGRQAPVGIAGELWIGGAGVCRGYLDRPGLSAEKLRPDPFAGVPGARLYRTGDRARFRSDGALEFLDRLDGQVKLRGTRIELGEIEAVLAEQPGVATAVALVREDHPGDQRLVAYVVPVPPGAGGEHALEPASLREALRQRVPEVMVPASVVVLEKLPLNANGKVDRGALPAPEALETTPEQVAQPPRSPIEELLAGIWAELLGLERRVGVDESFFELGGHSLLATQVMSRVRSLLQVELPLRALFEKPTVAGLAVEVEAALRCDRAMPPPLMPVPRDGEIPLSFAQQRLWFLQQLQPQSSAYNCPKAVEFSETIEVPLILRVLSEIVRRHEVLRTLLPTIDGQPVQQIQPASVVYLPVVDLSALAVRECAAEAARLGDEIGNLPFQLDRDTPLRLALLRLGSAEHRLLFIMHHVVTDAWSLGLLEQEVGALHAAFSQGLPSPLPELVVQYADYAIWQRRWLSGEVLSAEVAWWRRQLMGAPPVLELPADRTRPSVANYRGISQTLQLPEALLHALIACSHREGTTLFMTLLTGFQLLLSRWSGERDICVGTPIAGRNRLETEGLIGFFVNTLVLRTRLENDPDVRSLLKRVREATLEAHTHQDLPFEKLVEELQPERNLSHSPLFQVMFALQNVPRVEVVELASRVPRVGLTIRAAKFDLMLAMVEGPNTLGGGITYAAELFDATTIIRFSHQLERFFSSLVAFPEQRVSQLPLLSDAERHQLMIEHNDTGSAAPLESSISELFEQQARRCPERVAAVFGEEALSYAELDRRANQLAWHLKGLGVGLGAEVALFVERSLGMLVSLLGILKTGAAYVPLDPAEPGERLGYMLEQSGASVLLSTSKQLVGLVGESSFRLVLLDREREAINRQSRGALGVAVAGGELAYVMFTSGSTGRPKGVSIPHRGVTRLVCGSDYVQLGAEDVVAQASVATFDAATFEIWGALLNGGRLVGVTKSVLLAAPELSAEIARSRIGTLFVTTALFNQLSSEDGAVFGGLKCLLFGGEAVDPSRVGEVLRGRCPLRLLHVYGPTESTTFSTWHRVDSTTAGWRTIPIGRPIANTRVQVLSRELQPQAMGVAGELVIGGEGLSRGYFCRPRLSAERFVPDAHGEAGSRLYRTGDQVRLRSDGAVEFLGRVDHQVKLRGFRIELGEIEAVLGLHPEVGEAVVLLVEDPSGLKRLVAYWVGDRSSSAGATELRAFLSSKLPEYMVPSIFVRLESLPLTASGKVDRTALRRAELPAAKIAGAVCSTAPRTVVEEILCGIWAEVLGRELVGIEEDFFALGGHSLLATQVVSRIRLTFQIELPLRTLFEAPTVKGLAVDVETALRGAEIAALPPITTVSRAATLPLSFAQQRLWLIHQLEPGSPAYNVPIALRLLGEIDVTALESAFFEILRRHEVLRTSFSDSPTGPIQAIGAVTPVSVPIFDLGRLEAPDDKTELERLARADALRPFDLARGPMLRLGLVRCGEREHVMLLTMHHVATDAWSNAILVREVTALYIALSQGKPSPLPELRIQYADFALWQRKRLSGEGLEAMLCFWRKHLGGNPPLLELPTDRSRRVGAARRGSRRAFELPEPLGIKLGCLNRGRATTPFMALLAVFDVMLWRLTGLEDVVVGTAIAGRSHIETESLIGYFINMLPLRVKLDGHLRFTELLNRAREAALGAFVHQDIPLEKLVEELVPGRHQDGSSLFRVAFGFQNAPTERLEVSRLEIQPLELQSEQARFDLTVWVSETAGRLRSVWRYDSDLFESTTIEAWYTAFETILSQVVEAPETRLDDLEVPLGGQRKVTSTAPWEEIQAERLKNLGQRRADRSRSTLSHRALEVDP